MYNFIIICPICESDNVSIKLNNVNSVNIQCNDCGYYNLYYLRNVVM